MKIIRGIKIGGLQQKIFNLILIFIIAIIALFLSIGVVQQKKLSSIVEESNALQQQSIKQISAETMTKMLEETMSNNTKLLSYLANDLFNQVQSDVMTLQSLATQMFEHSENFLPHSFSYPKKENDAQPAVSMQHEKGVDPNSSASLALIANLSETMLSMFENSNKLNSCFIATADGCILFANDRSGAYVNADGSVPFLDVRNRPWYKQAAKAGKLIFTGVELDAFTDIPGIVCAAPIYADGKLAAVVGADIFLDSIDSYVQMHSQNGGFLAVIGSGGQVLFSAQSEGVFKPELSNNAKDLRKNDNAALANFVKTALKTNTDIEEIEIEGTSYYLCGSPLSTLGWSVVSVLNKEVTLAPQSQMLSSFDEIAQGSLNTYQNGTKKASISLVCFTVFIFALAIFAALLLASRIVKPIEHMTRRINALSGSDNLFEMEKIYKTNDEIEILASSFAQLSAKTVEYIEKITTITAEKERIGAELSLATRIQADMLPNIYPAFPDRAEFDIFATMEPAREVGGDFYDFFLVDDDHLCLMIADVSGKGVPAALFMMASRIMLANNAKLGLSPAEILTKTNEMICQNNREEMFVTVWLGVLEISSGKLTAANAGHEYPVLMQPGGEFELIKDKHGFVIGGMDGMKYKQYEIDLQPGSKLFLYTDGVPEATNSNNELFGTDRMLDALNKAKACNTTEILNQVRKTVDNFVLQAEQFDDLTMLSLEYRNNNEGEGAK